MLSILQNCTGDVNPIHILDSFAKTTMFKERIAHGMLVSSFISTILGTETPRQKYDLFIPKCFIPCPVKIGDTLRVVAEVIKKRDDKNHYAANKHI